MRDYQPFAYPPDYALARIHQQASMPGKVSSSNSMVCPCCQLPVRTQYESWRNRSIELDFSKYGGSVVTYFWLVRLYAFISFLVICVYSIYLVICIHQYCSYEQKCQKLLNLWIVSNENLYKIMKQHDHLDIMVRLFTLRGMNYIILLGGNVFSIYLVAKFKRRHPQPKNISAFALIFKNVKQSHQDLTLELKEKFPDMEVKELFPIRKMQPFYSAYQRKLSIYYQSLNQQNEKKKNKMLQNLAKEDALCNKSEESFHSTGDRVIVLLSEEKNRQEILNSYKFSPVEKYKYLLGIGDDRMYCEPCPIPQQIIWNHIGQEEKQKIRVKVMSVVYFLLLLLGSYVLLFFCMEIIYREVLPQPYNFILANILLIFLVFLALTFRFLMNKLSQMRHPNTQTSRSMFIIATTVSFHFIYYLIVPTVYFWLAEDVWKNRTLVIITNQTLNYVIVQFILAAIDLMYCCWSQRRKRVEDENKPIGCQKMLHNQIQYPRFPIEFKLIILFKTYSLTIFFAFQVPLIMSLTFLLLVYLYFKDKHSIYYHYRMQIIDNSVQLKILKIYSSFFSLYTFVIFVLTQHIEYELWIGFGLMVLSIIIQIFFINERKVEDDEALPQSFDELGFSDSYRKRYNEFTENIVCDGLDLEIKQYLAKNGYGSIETEDSARSNLL